MHALHLCPSASSCVTCASRHKDLKFEISDRAASTALAAQLNRTTIVRQANTVYTCSGTIQFPDWSAPSLVEPTKVSFSSVRVIADLLLQDLLVTSAIRCRRLARVIACAQHNWNTSPCWRRKTTSARPSTNKPGWSLSTGRCADCGFGLQAQLEQSRIGDVCSVTLGCTEAELSQNDFILSVSGVNNTSTAEDVLKTLNSHLASEGAC
jgi:hypothetical protein